MKNNWWKIAVVAALVIVVAIVIAAKNRNTSSTIGTSTESSAVATQTDGNDQPMKAEKQDALVLSETTATPEDATETGKSTAKPQVAKLASNESPEKTVDKPPIKTSKQLPRIVDLGATECIPCKMMAPILDELKEEYKGKLVVEFIDVWENPDEKGKYRISSIPTQIFYDTSGKEFYRHIGFFPKEDILAKFEEQGIILKK